MLRAFCSVIGLFAAAAVLRGQPATPAYCRVQDPAYVSMRSSEPPTGYTSFLGRAVTDAGVFWYTEHHALRATAGGANISTRYVAADGTLIAELSAEITTNRYLPATRLIDHRDNYIYSITPNRDRHVVVLTQQLGRSGETRKTLALRDDLMTFQGVLLYIIDQRAALQRGQSLFVRSIVPSRMTSYGLRIYKRASDGNLLTVRLDMSSAAFRFFSTPSDVTIDVASGRLLEFAGPSNLLDDKDRPVSVHIVYEYQ
jgi:hypothetical protein